MSYHIQITKRQLHFKQPEGTSRGVYRHETSHIISNHWRTSRPLGNVLRWKSSAAIGFRTTTRFCRKACRDFEQSGKIDFKRFSPYPSVLFRTETALAALSERQIPPLGFTLLSRWTGHFRLQRTHLDGHLIKRCCFALMRSWVKDSVASRVKIGAIDFEEEIKLQTDPKRYSINDTELRVDANGGILPSNKPRKTSIGFAELDIHSIAKLDDWRHGTIYAWICEESPIPIALDEQLIGVINPLKKHRLLDQIRPQYIVLGFTLHGGIQRLYRMDRRGPSPTHRMVDYFGVGIEHGNWTPSQQWCATLGNPNAARVGYRSFSPTTLTFRWASKGMNWFDPHITPQIGASGYRHRRLRNRFKNDLEHFLNEWEMTPYIKGTHSGSTGKPKEMLVEKQRMRNSARITCDFLQLKREDTSSLHAARDFIAGKMIMVRAWTLELIAVTPSSQSWELGRPYSLLPWFHAGAGVCSNIAGRRETAERERESERETGSKIETAGSSVEVYRQAARRETATHSPCRLFHVWHDRDSSNIALRDPAARRLQIIKHAIPWVHLRFGRADVCHRCSAQPKLSTPTISQRFTLTAASTISGRMTKVSGGIKIQTWGDKLRSDISSNFGDYCSKRRRFRVKLSVLLIEKRMLNLTNDSVRWKASRNMNVPNGYWRRKWYSADSPTGRSTERPAARLLKNWSILNNNVWRNNYHWLSLRYFVSGALFGQNAASDISRYPGSNAVNRSTVRQSCWTTMEGTFAVCKKMPT